MMAEPIVEQLVIELGNLQARIQKKVGSALSVHGLGLSDYFVLNQLYVAPTQTMRRHDLAELVGLSPSGITRLLLPLEKIGLVEKETNPRDARVSLVILSAAGKQLYEDARLSFAEASSQLFKSLNAEQQNNLLVMLQALR